MAQIGICPNDKIRQETNDGFRQRHWKEVIDRTPRELGRGGRKGIQKRWAPKRSFFEVPSLLLAGSVANFRRPLRQTRIRPRHDGEATDQMHGGEELYLRYVDHLASAL